MSGPWPRGLPLPSDRHPKKAFLWWHQFVHADHHVAHWVISDAFHANFTIWRLAIRSPNLKAIDGPLRSAKRMALVFQGLIKAHLIAWMFDHSNIINQVVSTNTCLWIIAYIGFFLDHSWSLCVEIQRLTPLGARIIQGSFLAHARIHKLIWKERQKLFSINVSRSCLKAKFCSSRDLHSPIRFFPDFYGRPKFALSASKQ